MAQFNVNLAFNADTGKAKTQIMELQSLLNKIAYSGATGGTDKLQTDLHAASEAAKELQFHLNNAFNASTGNFDLSMLDRSLKTSGSNVTDLSMKLLSAGATGQQAFVKLAQSISLADQPMFRISKRMQDFAVTMKNTVKWQLSSSMLHGFMGAVQSAYGYAQDLNKSLNDIRIVTGYNTDKMAEFAEQANKAAKALSTTTTDYTNASLIYFQQGLSDEEVTARTDITVKMANAVGQSAEVVSEQLTAVWNNFADGSQSLEYYVDVMTALGAATASSSDEISEGLSKFAAVAETVGLSYEYATAALTTLTSNTRESADVVGNALKTLFARIQGLQLGETLDDGTDLNKYSQALEKVGISIYDANGGLKSMDATLDEMAAKWNTLTGVQQVALAQTVAGVRQYNQLIALMENWNNGDADSMQANLNTISNSEGALNKQAEIYAQSWEAAEKRVQAAAEGIYQSLLDDDFFISLTNGFANVLNGIDAFIDGAGGIKTVLIGIASIITTTFAHKIPGVLDNFVYNLEFMTKGVNSAYSRIQKQMNDATQDTFTQFNETVGKNGIKEDSSMGYAIKSANELTAARNKLALVSDRMSSAEKQMAETSLSLIQKQQEEVIALKQKNEQLQESINLQKKQIQTQGISDSTKSSALSQNNNLSETFDIITDELESDQKKLKGTRSGKIKAEINERVQAYQEGLAQIKTFSKALHEEIDSINEGYDILGQQILDKYLSKDFQQNKEKYSMSIFGDLDFENGASGLEKMVSQIDIFIQKKESMSNPQNFQAAKDEIAALGSTIPPVIQEATGLDVIFRKIADNKLTSTTEELQTNFDELKDKLKSATINGQDFEKVLKKLYGKSIDQLVNDMQLLANNEEKAAQKAGVLKNLLNEFNPQHVVRTSEALGALAGMAGSAVTAINGIISIFKSWTNPDLSGWEKVSATLSGFAMIIPGVISIIRNWATSLAWVNTQMVTSTASAWLYNAATVALGGAITKETAAELMRIAVTEKAKGTDQEAIRVKLLAALANNTALTAAQKDIIVKFAQNAATKGLTMATWELITAWIAANAVTLGWVAVIGILIAALVAMGVAAYNAYHADEKAAENARKAVEDLTESYKRLTDEANTFKDAVSNYEDAVASLKDLEKGTDEYREALEKANEQARQLIETYGLWGQTHYDENGVITFNEGVLEGKQTEYDTRVREAESQLYGAKIASNEANIRSETTDLRRELGNIVTETVQSSVSNTTPYAAGTNAYSATSPYAASQQQQTYNRQLTNDEVQQIAKALELAEQKVIAGEYDSLEAALGSIDEWNNLSSAVRGSIDAIIANKDAFAQLTNTMNNADSANEYYAGEIIRNTVEEQSGAQLREMATGTDGKVDEGLYNQLVNAATEREKAKQAEASEQYNNGLADQIAGATAYKNVVDTNDLKNFGDGRYADVNNDEDLAYRYAKDVLGYTDEELATFDYKSGNGVGTLVDAKGNKIMDQVNDEYMRQQLARQAEIDMITKKYEQDYASDTGEGSAQAYIDSLGTMVEQSSALGSKFGVDFTNHLLSAIANGTGSFDFSSLYSELSPAEHAELIAMTPDELVQTLGLTPEMLQQMGFESAEEFEAAFDEGLAGWTPEDFTEGINAKYEKKAEDYGIDVEEFRAYRDLLLQTNSALAEQPELLNKITLRQKRLQKGVKSLSDNWEDFNEAMSSKDMAKISEVLPDINDALKDMLDLTDEEFEGLSPDFAVKNWELIQDYMNGVEGSYERIQTAAAAEIIFGASYDLDGLQDSEQAVIDEMLAFQAEHGDLEIGATIDTSEALSGLWSLYDSGKMTVGQLQEAFNSLGWEPEIEYVPVDAETAAAMRSAGYQEYAVMNSDGSMSIHSVPLDGELVQSSDQQYYIPKIKSKNATNTGGSRPPSPPEPSSKGGGGGGSKKHAEKKDSGDRTRYHTIQNQLEDLSAAYDEVSEAADRAFGLEKLDLIDEQISATDDLIAKQKEYVDALAKDVPVDKAVMDAYYDDLIGGPAMEFDENGNIANYDEIEAAMHAKYNEMADKYTDDSEEWQVFEKQYEQMEKYIEDYEKYYDDLRDAEAEYQNLINQRIDLQLQKVQYKVELELDIENDEMELLEYQLSLIEDDAFKSAEAITLLTKQAESLYDQIQVNKKGLNDTLGLSLSAAEITSVMAGDLSVLDGKTFTEDQIGAIRDYRDNLLALNEQFNEVRQSIEEQVMATFDAWQEKLERGSATLEHYGSILESYQNIVDIIGTDTLGLSSQFMADLSQAKVDNSIDQLEAAKSSYEAVSAAQKEAQEALAAAQAAGDEKSISMWEETLITLNEEAQAASEELMAAWEEALSGIVEAFDMAVDRAVQDFNDAIYSLGGVEGLLDAFSNAQETSDLMLEDYQQIYELSKLSRDINNSIDDTENLAGKQKLKKLLGEINKLQEEGVEMSQYDLEYLQAEYQLRLAEIELEEAQNAKNTVRLQKDNEGNWSYVYTQNTDAVDEAQQKYEDALYAMQDLSSNYIDEMSEQLINTSQEMAEALAALRVEDFASIDEYYAEVERVQAEYEEKMALQENELQKAIDNNKELYDTDWTNYHNATGYKISDTEEFVTSFKDSLLGTLLDSESDTANFADILGQATASLTSNLMEAAATYYQNLDSAMEAAGTTTEGFAEDTKANIEAIVEASTTGAEAIDQMATEMTEAFSAITDSVTSWQETYGVAMQEIIDSNIAVIESFNDMIAALAIDEGSVTVKYDISSAPETDAAQFDTGGYTGTWGNAGKVAVLHEKELILNEDDTSNFLSAIQVTRAMLETIDLNAKQASMGVGNLVPSTVKDEVVQTLEQEVHITAEFPNVSDHNEVEEALKNLMNTASQYANRKS